MPISTPPELLNVYGGDTRHFGRVMEHLFSPVVQEIGYQPVPPAVAGSDVIHANIISNLSASDLVLCDMSALNPNVFFELGIRTALNKPVCLVKDDVTLHVPFDTSIVNYHTYGSRLPVWTIEEEKLKLKTHIEKTLSSEHAGNALWHYFGISHTAHLSTTKTGEDARFEYLVRKIDHVSTQLGNGPNEPQPRQSLLPSPATIPDMLRAFREKEHLTDANLADRIGIRPEIIEGLYSGEVVPSHALVWKILRVVSGASS